LLLEAIHSVFGYDFRQYARSTLKRRLKEVAAKRGLASLSELQGRVLRDPELLNAVVTALSVQVSSFFRDSHFFLAFRRKVVPFLKTYPSLRLWHAGCATGEEVYSTAIVLMEEQLLNRSQIYATDVNVDALDAASRGGYTAETISSSELGYKASGGNRSLADYFQVVGKRARFREDFKERINFFRHNLVTDNSFKEFHVILCRNVLIYFGKPLQDRVHEILYNSLVPFGVLGLGAHETLHLTPKQKRYRTLDDMARLYRRMD
jgi:chemotaxis protein methyltransferase CheR